VPPQDVLCGSITLERAVDGFPRGTVHLAVVDPGVGTDRRLIVAQINEQLVVCPDNGLVTWSWRLHPGGQAHEITWRPDKFSATFHGRDVLAPISGRLASGKPVAEIARPIDDPILLDIFPADSSASSGRIIHLDHFGNATTNIAAPVVRRSAGRNGRAVRVKGRPIGKLRKTYWDVAPGKPLALIGSSGLIEIAVRDGSAARELKLKVGDEVSIS
jgi:S-adenosyl-L-methionine hydrolase (adenosine-forming)